MPNTVFANHGGTHVHFRSQVAAVIILVTGLFQFASLPAVAADVRTVSVTGELKVFDGDTLEVGPLLIRLHGKIISCLGEAFGSRAV